MTDATRLASALNVVIVGHVDHGKSTLIGRMLHETGSLPEGKLEATARACREAGREFEFAFLLDALEEERDQGITIDTARIRFRAGRRDCVIIDAPGHKEFLKNMVSGAAAAEAALLLIDAEEGVQEQSRRHGYLLKLLGIRQIAVVINKMDLVNYCSDAFGSIRDQYLEFLQQAGIAARFVIPVSASLGDNITMLSDRTPWYNGPTVLEALDLFEPRVPREDAPLRLPVQDVYKFDRRRIIAGRIESGSIREGDQIVFSPSGHRGAVKTIERWQSSRNGAAVAGESIGITLSEQLFIERGDIVSHPDDVPTSSRLLQANVFWLGDRHLTPGRGYVLKLATQEVECQVSSISGVLDTSTLASVGAGASEVAKNEVATVGIELKKPVAYDSFSGVVETGRFVIVDDKDVAGGGIITQTDVAHTYQI